MKQIILYLVICTACFSIKAQTKLHSTSSFDYVDSTATYVLVDSQRFFYSPSNTLASVQAHNDRHVFSQEDSAWYIKPFISPNFKQARIFKSYTPNYSALLEYRDTVLDSNGIPFFSNTNVYYYTGALLDSIYRNITMYSPSNAYTSMKQYYSYNASNKMDTSWNIYLNSSGNFASSNRQTYLYNVSNLDSIVYDYESTDSITYTPDQRTQYYYSANGLIDSMIISMFVSNSWVRVAGRQYVYNASNERVLMNYIGISPTNVYSITSKDEYLRMNGTKLDTIYSSLWNSGFNKFDTTIKFGCVINNGLLERNYGYTYHVPTSTWKPYASGAIINYYYNITTGFTHTNESETKLILYPNPVSNVLHFNQTLIGKRFTIIASDGRMVQNGFIESKNTISTSNLTKGIYHVIIDGDKETYSQTFYKN